MRHYASPLLILFVVQFLSYGNESVDTKQAKELMDSGRYEQAQIILEDGLLEINRHAHRYNLLAQIESARANPEQAVGLFLKGLRLCDSFEVDDRHLPSKYGEILDVVDLLRSRGLLPIAHSILKALESRIPNDTSLLYEKANYYLANNEIGLVVPTYYDAYKKDASNCRGFAAKAILEDRMDRSKPTADAFPLLSAAAANIDNLNLWSMAMMSLKENQLLQQQEAVASLANALDLPLQHAFMTLCFTANKMHDRAMEEMEKMEPYLHTDSRFELLWCQLMTSLDRHEERKCSLSDHSLGPRDKLAYHFITLDSLSDGKWPEQDTIKCCNQIIQELSEVTMPYLTEEQVQVNSSTLLLYIARNMISNGYVDKATSLFESNYDILDLRSQRILVALYVSLNKYNDVINTQEKLLEEVSPGERAAILEDLLDYALLTDSFVKFRKGLDYARLNQIDSVYEKYASLQHDESEVNSKTTVDVQGHFMLGTGNAATSPLFAGLGPCVRGSVYSLLNFWGDNTPYADIHSSIDRALIDDEYGNPTVLLVEWFKKKGYNLHCYVPTKEVIAEFLCRGLPLLVVVDPAFVEDYESTPGFYDAHMGVAYAFDNCTEKVFLKDTSSVGQMKIRYDEISKMLYVIAVVPSAESTVVLPGACAKLECHPTTVFTPSHIKQISLYNEGLEYWCQRQNGYALNINMDPNSILWFEKCLELETSKIDIGLYECLISNCIKHDRQKDALVYIEKGLSLVPDHLFFLDLMGTARYNSIPDGKDGLHDLLEVLALTEKMEQINAHYPETYWLRAKVYAKANAPGLLRIDSIVRYLEECNRAQASWQKKYAARVRLAKGVLLKERTSWKNHLRGKK